MKTIIRLILAFLLIFVSAVISFADWQVLEPGLELGKFKVSHSNPAIEAEIIILRINPRKWNLVLQCAAQTDGANLTASRWRDKYNLVAVINAGMFGQDYRTHVGYMKNGEHINSSHINSYKSVAAFGAKTQDAAPYRIYDLDEPDISMAQIISRYAGVVQNLRLIKRPGDNRWGRQERMWSEAALGEDRFGNALFIFCRAPFTMQDFNSRLLSLGIGLVSAQHLEGGPEAQLAVKIGGVNLELCGSYETDFRPDDANKIAWPIPNVIGVSRKSATTN